MVLWLEYPSAKRLRMVRTARPDVWMATAAENTLAAFNELARVPAGAVNYSAFASKFNHLKLSGDGWYQDAREMREWVAALPRAVEGLSGSGRPVSFSDETALEIFRAAHAGDRADSAIARDYGVSAMTVSLLARGQTRRHLFNVSRTEGDGWYTVSERRDGAPVYRMNERRRR